MSKTQYEVSSATHQWVRAIAPGTAVNTVLVVESANLKEARNGPFWMLDLKDATGSLSARIWSPLSQMFTDIPTGALVVVEGRAERYREQIQCSVTGLRVLDEEETAGVDASIFMPASARSPLIMLEELEAMADAVFVHEPWKDFARRVLRDEDIRPRLLKASAARGIHHARVGGLLEHTLGVARLCLHFVELYPQLDRQTLLAGAICHDLGKLWELTSGLTTDYTDEGRLAGHIFLGLERLRPHMEAAGLEEPLRLHLQHLVLSHHGQYEFGSPRLPQTAEALALHYADNVDAKMDQCRALFGDMAPQEAAWSPFQRSLDRAMYRAPRTPDGTAVPDEKSGEMPQAFAQDDFFEADFPQDALPQNEFPADEFAGGDVPPDDVPQGEFLEGDVPPDDFPQADFIEGGIPQADFAEDDVPQDDIPENDVPEGAFPPNMPEYEYDPGPEALLACLPNEADSRPVTDRQTESAAEEAPADSAAAESAESVGEEHTRTKKSRMEARQCSLL